MWTPTNRRIFPLLRPVKTAADIIHFNFQRNYYYLSVDSAGRPRAINAEHTYYIVSQKTSHL